ncbi:hypothetical protein_gp229 [Bacillus phage vB_BceM_WH1]|nr:hypothetical protein_gp229 [Bacillus phage vB_BceM_WH1]
MNVGASIYSYYENAWGVPTYRKYTVVYTEFKYEHGIPPHLVDWLEENKVPYGPHWSIRSDAQGWRASPFIRIDQVTKEEYERYKNNTNKISVSFFKQEELY